MVTSIPNFRQVVGTKLYRCGQPERVTEEDLQYLCTEMNVVTILDLRSNFELKMLQKSGKMEKLDLVYSPTHLVQEDFHADGTHPRMKNAEKEPRRYTHDLLSTLKFKGVLEKRLPWYIRLFVFPMLLLLDQIFKLNWVVKVAVHYSMNPFGILGQYKDIVDHCGETICAGMYVLSTITCQLVICMATSGSTEFNQCCRMKCHKKSMTFWLISFLSNV